MQYAKCPEVQDRTTSHGEKRKIGDMKAAVHTLRSSVSWLIISLPTTMSATSDALHAQVEVQVSTEWSMVHDLWLAWFGMHCISSAGLCLYQPDCQWWRKLVEQHYSQKHWLHIELLHPQLSLRTMVAHAQYPHCIMHRHTRALATIIHTHTPGMNSLYCQLRITTRTPKWNALNQTKYNAP